MNLALVSPLPPASSGVADFAARLAAGLSRFHDVRAIHDAAGVELREFDQRLYQIGNNPLHGPAYEAALAVPGVVELHDAVLHHFLLGRLEEEAYIEEMVYNGGEWLRDRARALWARRGASAGDEQFFRYPLLRRVTESADKVIVHNPAAGRLAHESCRERHPEIVEIPHFIDPPPPLPAERLRAVRRELGVEPDALLIGCFGYQRPTKRLRSVLEAVQRLEHPWKLLVAGAFVSKDYEASLNLLLQSPGVIRTGHLSPQRLHELAAAVDVCVNLRWPTAGETSGIAMRLLAAGKPVIVTESEEWAGFPDGALVRIDHGPAEAEMLAAQLNLLGREPQLRRAIGAAGQAHVRDLHDFERVLDLYRAAL